MATLRRYRSRLKFFKLWPASQPAVDGAVGACSVGLVRVAGNPRKPQAEIPTCHGIAATHRAPCPQIIFCWTLRGSGYCERRGVWWEYRHLIPFCPLMSRRCLTMPLPTARAPARERSRDPHTHNLVPGFTRYSVAAPVFSLLVMIWATLAKLLCRQDRPSTNPSDTRPAAASSSRTRLRGAACRPPPPPAPRRRPPARPQPRLSTHPRHPTAAGGGFHAAGGSHPPLRAAVKWPTACRRTYGRC